MNLYYKNTFIVILYFVVDIFLLRQVVRIFMLLPTLKKKLRTEGGRSPTGVLNFFAFLYFFLGILP